MKKEDFANEALIRVGILEEVSGTANPKYFIAREIRDIINASVKLNG